jgi:hypothetical protein
MSNRGMTLEWSGAKEIISALFLAEVHALKQFGDEHNVRTLCNCIAHEPFGLFHIVTNVI